MSTITWDIVIVVHDSGQARACNAGCHMDSDAGGDTRAGSIADGGNMMSSSDSSGIGGSVQ